MHQQQENRVPLVRPLTKTQLSRGYGINIKTFNKWLRPLYKVMGKPLGRLFTPMQVRVIFQELGRPIYPERM